MSPSFRKKNSTDKLFRLAIKSVGPSPEVQFRRPEYSPPDSNTNWTICFGVLLGGIMCLVVAGGIFSFLTSSPGILFNSFTPHVGITIIQSPLVTKTASEEFIFSTHFIASIPTVNPSILSLEVTRGALGLAYIPLTRIPYFGQPSNQTTNETRSNNVSHANSRSTENESQSKDESQSKNGISQDTRLNITQPSSDCSVCQHYHKSEESEEANPLVSHPCYCLSEVKVASTDFVTFRGSHTFNMDVKVEQKLETNQIMAEHIATDCTTLKRLVLYLAVSNIQFVHHFGYLSPQFPLTVSLELPCNLTRRT